MKTLHSITLTPAGAWYTTQDERSGLFIETHWFVTPPPPPTPISEVNDEWDRYDIDTIQLDIICGATGWYPWREWIPAPEGVQVCSICAELR